jgi:hypothetical protein
LKLRLETERRGRCPGCAASLIDPPSFIIAAFFRKDAFKDLPRINPERVAWELSPRLPDGVVLTSDSGSCANWYAPILCDGDELGHVVHLHGAVADQGNGEA